MLLALLAISVTAQAQIAPCVQTGGFTRSYSQSTVGGTFVPPQTHVESTYYNYPGISAFGAYPGSGYAYEGGVGFTPFGYTPYSAFTYL